MWGSLGPGEGISQAHGSPQLLGLLPYTARGACPSHTALLRPQGTAAFLPRGSIHYHGQPTALETPKAGLW